VHAEPLGLRGAQVGNLCHSTFQNKTWHSFSSLIGATHLPSSPSFTLTPYYRQSPFPKFRRKLNFAQVGTEYTVGQLRM